MRLIGIDCATAEANIGVALGNYTRGKLSVDDARQCSRREPALATLLAWIRSDDSPVLLAFDAPLGWPMALGPSLRGHRAGDEISERPNLLFRRATDRFIASNIGKTPLDVGADRIARTAHAALVLLGALRRELSDAIPLAWSPRQLPRLSAIEVYPAATSVARGYSVAPYKKPSQSEARRALLAQLRRHATIRASEDGILRSADALDAALCLAAAADFMAGKAAPPRNRHLAKREGWIWVRLSSNGRAREA